MCPLSRFHRVEVRPAYFDLGSHSCNLSLPPRSRGMALTDHLIGWEVILKPLLTDMNAFFLAITHWTLNCFSPVESAHYAWLFIRHAAAAGSPEIPPPPSTLHPAAATDLSKHLSHTPETPTERPLPHAGFVLSCAGDKRSFSVFTSGLREINDKSVHWDLRVSRPKRPLEPPLTPQSNRPLKNTLRLFLPPLSLFLHAAAFLHQLSKKYCSSILLSLLSLWQHSQALLILSFVWVGQIPPQEGC